MRYLLDVNNHTMNHVHVRTSLFGFAQVGTWCISMSVWTFGPSRSRFLMIELIDVSWRIPVLSSVKYNSCAVSIPSLKLPKRKRSYSNHPFSGRTVSFRELCQRKYVIYTYHTPTKNTNTHTTCARCSKNPTLLSKKTQHTISEAIF